MRTQGRMFDFYSDTKTKPSTAMLEAVLTSQVGDEQKNEDPTTLELCERVAALLGKEAAVYLPSGTMCNQISIRVHTRPGDEIICERSCHIVNSETGGPAVNSSVMIHTVEGDKGFMTPKQVEKAIRPPSPYLQVSKLLCVEQTANFSGGSVWPLDQIQGVAKVAKKEGLATHMDGARLMNAVVKSGIPAADWVEQYDSCWIDFSKGLGAPVGAVLAGSSEFIAQAWRVKHQMGGAMRQSGVLAAMCLYALDHNVDRLAEDHALASRIGETLQSMSGVEAIMPVETNIIILDLSADAPTAPDMVDALRRDGVLVGAFGERRMRIVTHLDVNEEAADVLCDRFRHHLLSNQQ